MRFIDFDKKRSHYPEHGIKTGMTDYDALIQGFKPGQLVIVAARTSMGKSMLVTNWLENIADQGYKAVIFSMEMPYDEILERMSANQGSIKLNKFNDCKQLTDSDYERLSELMRKFKTHPRFIHDQAALTLSDLRRYLRKMKYQVGLDCVFVDYLQLMEVEKYTANENERVATLSRGLKRLAMDLNVPIIATAQLNRAADQRQDKRPVMSDLRSSGSIEQDADIVSFIYRDEVYYPDSDHTDLYNAGIAELDTVKFRKGKPGRVYLQFDGTYCRFRDLAKDVQYQPSYKKSYKNNLEQL